MSSENTKLVELLSAHKVSDALHQNIFDHSEDDNILWDTLTVVNADLAVVKGHRSEWGSTGGIGYWAQCHVFFGPQHKMQEWQWRDRYNPNNDEPWLSFNSFGEVKVLESDGKTEVLVELVHVQHANRRAVFIFEASVSSKATTLSKGDHDAFTIQANAEVERIIADMKRLHEMKPTMPSDYPGASGYVHYHQPRVKQLKVHASIGVAAFVVEEQIDHCVTDRQMRHELYVLKHGQGQARQMAEDHGYTRHEGGAFLAILDVTADGVEINTKTGKRQIKI
jgi:hypothetical protein